MDFIKIRNLPLRDSLGRQEGDEPQVEGAYFKNVLKDIESKYSTQVLKLGNKKMMQLKTGLKKHFTQRRHGEYQ